MKGGQSAENFDPRGDGNNHSGGSEVGTRIYVHSDREHVVGSYDKPEEANCYHGSDHAHVAEGLFFTGVVGYDMGDHSKAGEN